MKSYMCLLWSLALFHQHYSYKMPIAFFYMYFLCIKILYITLVPILLFKTHLFFKK